MCGGRKNVMLHYKKKKILGYGSKPHSVKMASVVIKRNKTQQSITNSQSDETIWG